MEKIWQSNDRGKIQINTFSLIPIFYTTEKVLFNVLWSIVVSEMNSKILYIWLNSTFGHLPALTSTDVTEGPGIAYKKEEIWKLPVLDVNSLTETQKNEFIDLFDEFKNSKFKLLQNDFKQPNLRRKIYEKISQILHLKVNLNWAYELLNEELIIDSSFTICFGRQVFVR